jgi:pSer/pThr/pTyr-binding forkhead associated (FHA) protein
VKERSYLQLWRPDGWEVVSLETDRATVGAATSNEVAVPDDVTISRIHAVLEHFPAGWCVRDLGSTNGTFVNGERVWGERPLRDHDEIRVGETRLIFRSEAPIDARVTASGGRRPELTRREKDVLIALCRPVFSGEPFKEPASIREIAQRLVVTEDAVKQHLIRLYRKFGIAEGQRRRVRLANEAILRGAVNLSDIDIESKRPT